MLQWESRKNCIIIWVSGHEILLACDDIHTLICCTALSCLQSLSMAGNGLEVTGVSSLVSGLPVGIVRLNLSNTCTTDSIVDALLQHSQHFSEVRTQSRVLTCYVIIDILRY